MAICLYKIQKKLLFILLIIWGINISVASFSTLSHAFAETTDDQVNVEENTEKHYWRTALEMTALLSMVSAYYWGSFTYKDDFDYELRFDTLYKKFSGRAIRFDDNDINLNSFPGHPLSGSYYYLIPRSHNLSPFESFLWASLSSSIFEFFIELQETVSINDLVVTPFAGSTIGEAYYQFGKYFRCAHKRHSILYKAFAPAANPIAFVNSFIWHDTGYKLPADTACNDDPLFNNFDFIFGVSSFYDEDLHHRNLGFVAGFHGKIYLLPQLKQDFSAFLSKTILVELGFETILSDQGLDSWHFFAKTVWAGYYKQNITQDRQDEKRGYSILLGYASSFDHIQYDASEFEDWIGAVHLFGPAFELKLFYPHGYILLGLDAFADFGMVRSFAFDVYKEDHNSLRGTKTVLRNYDYYYAFGVTLHPKVDIRYGPYKFTAEYIYSHYDSFEGADRRGDLTNDFNLIDERKEYLLTIGRRLDFLPAQFFAEHPVWIEAQAQRRFRSGYIADDAVYHKGDNTWFMIRLRISP